MLNDDERSRLVRRAGIIALAGNIFLSIIKIAFAFLSKSLAVLGDSIDSATDVGIAIVAIFIAGIIKKPGDKKHPWGHWRAETTACMALSFVIFFAGFELFRSGAKTIFTHNYNLTVGFHAIISSCISIFGKTFLALNQYSLAKRSQSKMIMANAKNMTADIMLSGGVLLGVTFAKLFSLPILDPIVALALSVWIMRNAVMIFFEANIEVMDGTSDLNVYKWLFDAVTSVQGVSNPHRARMRKIGMHWDVELDIEVAPNMSVLDAHEIVNKVERAVKNAIPNIYDITIHVEPCIPDYHNESESYGLTLRDVK